MWDILYKVEGTQPDLLCSSLSRSVGSDMSSCGLCWNPLGSGSAKQCWSLQWSTREASVLWGLTHCICHLHRPLQAAWRDSKRSIGEKKKDLESAVVDGPKMGARGKCWSKHGDFSSDADSLHKILDNWPTVQGSGWYGEKEMRALRMNDPDLKGSGQSRGWEFVGRWYKIRFLLRREFKRA